MTGRTAGDEAARARRKLPRTLRPVPGDGVVQRPVFDPSLKHYASAMRAGDPQFEDQEMGTRWYAARRVAVDQVLAAVSGSEWADNLVLRGSALLKAWYGDTAREPGDLDFVVVPESWRMGEHRTVRMHLPTAPEPTLIPRSDGGDPALVNAATPELSLAWKLVWLLSDWYPQGKDLYDAALLAENTPLRHRLLREALVVTDSSYARRTVTSRELSALEIDWDEFRKEYPHIPGNAQEYLDRLATALAPTFAQPYDHLGDAYERHVRWHAWRIPSCRALLAQEGMDAVLRHLAGPDLLAIDGIVIVRELLGPRACTLDEATAVLLRSHTWRGWAGYYQRNPDKLAADIATLRGE